MVSLVVMVTLNVWRSAVARVFEHVAVPPSLAGVAVAVQ